MDRLSDREWREALLDIMTRTVATDASRKKRVACQGHPER